MNKAIYAITVMSIDRGSVSSMRTMGYFFDQDKAISALEKNTCNIWEEYQYALIERIEPGIYPTTKELQWFASQFKDFEFIKAVGIQKPALLRSIYRFAIG